MDWLALSSLAWTPMLGAFDPFSVLSIAAAATLTLTTALWRRIPAPAFIAWVLLSTLLTYFVFLGHTIYWYEIREREPSARDYDYSCENYHPESDRWQSNCMDARLADKKPVWYDTYDKVSMVAVELLKAMLWAPLLHIWTTITTVSVLGMVPIFLRLWQYRRMAQSKQDLTQLGSLFPAAPASSDTDT